MFASYALAIGFGLAVIGLFYEVANHYRWSKRRKGWGGIFVTAGTMGVVLLLAERVNNIFMATACACSVLALSIRVSQNAIHDKQTTFPEGQAPTDEQAELAEEVPVVAVEELEELVEELQIIAVAEQEELVEELQVIDIAEPEEHVKEVQVIAVEEQEELLEEMQIIAVAEQAELVEELQVIAIAEPEELVKEVQVIAVEEQEELLEEMQIIAVAEQEELVEEMQVVAVAEQEEFAVESQVVAVVEQETIAEELHTIEEQAELVEEVSAEWFNMQIANGFAAKSEGLFAQALQSFEAAAAHCQDAELTEMLRDEIADCYFSMTLTGGLKVLHAS